MRLGVLSTSYPRWPGDAAGRFVGELARWLAARGHDVEVIAAGPGAARDGDVEVTRIHAGAGLFYGEGAPDRLERSGAGWSRAPLFSAALAAAALRRARRWDRVLSHWLLPCGLAGAALGLPHLAVAHSADVHLASRPVAADLLCAALAASRTRVVFVASHLRARLAAATGWTLSKRLLNERSLICPMGADTAALASLRDGDRDAARRRLGVEGKVVGFLGRLVPIKGIAVLLAALPAGATLLVAGEGPLRPTLEGRAVLLGEVSGPRRDDFFRAIDVLCVPSVTLPGGRTEGAPLVVIEGMAAGVPVVASEVGGIPDLAAGAVWLCPPGDAVSLRVALEEALRGDDVRVERGRGRAAELGWDVIGPKLEAALLHV